MLSARRPRPATAAAPGGAGVSRAPFASARFATDCARGVLPRLIGFLAFASRLSKRPLALAVNQFLAYYLPPGRGCRLSGLEQLLFELAPALNVSDNTIKFPIGLRHLSASFRPVGGVSFLGRYLFLGVPLEEGPSSLHSSSPSGIFKIRPIAR